VRSIEQLQGAAVPASALETLVLPSRVPGYQPALLDELTSSGEVMWVGQGSLPGGDGWVSLYFADTAPLLLPDPAEITMTPVHEGVLDLLSGGGALFFRGISDQLGTLDDATMVTALWDLVWSGRVSGDTLAPLRATLGTGRPAHRPATTRRRRAVLPTRSGPPTVAGRWWLLPGPVDDATQRANAQAEVLLERHGVVTRGSVTSERLPGGFTPIYQVLRAYEEGGRCRRGYFVEGLGGAQFALPGAVDRMRAMAPGLTPASYPGGSLGMAASGGTSASGEGTGTAHGEVGVSLGEVGVPGASHEGADVTGEGTGTAHGGAGVSPGEVGIPGASREGAGASSGEAGALGASREGAGVSPEGAGAPQDGYGDAYGSGPFGAGHDLGGALTGDYGTGESTG
ncbi:Lhr family helicase, partial [Nonomuraea antri]